MIVCPSPQNSLCAERQRVHPVCMALEGPHQLALCSTPHIDAAVSAAAVYQALATPPHTCHNHGVTAHGKQAAPCVGVPHAHGLVFAAADKAPAG